MQEQLRNVHRIQATFAAFSAILQSGAIVTWGRADNGGDSSPVQEQLSNVQHIQATDGDFAAILESGADVTWVGQTGTKSVLKEGSQTGNQLRILLIVICVG